jgi:hypothetical protein
MNPVPTEEPHSEKLSSIPEDANSGHKGDFNYSVRGRW